MPSINDNLEKGYLSLSQTFHNNGPQHTSELPLPVFNSQVTEDYIAQDIQRIRHELRAEVQLTIARELEKLKLFLSKYYLKDVIKPNKQ